MTWHLCSRLNKKYADECRFLPVVLIFESKSMVALETSFSRTCNHGHRRVGKWRKHYPTALSKGGRGSVLPHHNSTMGNFMVYQDRFETNLLQLFVQQENSECFSIISAIIFEVNIVAEQKQTYRLRFVLFISFHCP